MGVERRPLRLIFREIFRSSAVRVGRFVVKTMLNNLLPPFPPPTAKSRRSLNLNGNGLGANVPGPKFKFSDKR